MKSETSGLLKGFSWVLLANLVYLATSAFITLGLPKFTSPLEFALWQLYQLYALYLGYVTFGYSDGINLRIAGREPGQTPPKQLSSGISLMLLFDLLLFGGILFCAQFFTDASGLKILGLATIGTVFYLAKTAISVVFQSTGQVRRYSVVLTSERLLLSLLIIVAVATDHTSITWLASADIAAKAFSLVLAVALGTRDIGALPKLNRETWAFFISDCKAGLSVLFANLSAMLINGGTRGIIVAQWGLLVFGQVSLAFQFAAFFMVVVNSVAITALPNLKRSNEELYPTLYLSNRDRAMKLLLPCLLLSFPMAYFLKLWLPEYSDAAFYLVLFFPFFIFEYINRALTAVFMKALRMEKSLLVINLSSMIVSLAFAAISAFVIESLIGTVLSVVLGLCIRSVLSEFVLSRRLGIALGIRQTVDIAIVALFTLAVLKDTNPILVAILVGSLALRVLPHNAWKVRN